MSHLVRFGMLLLPAAMASCTPSTPTDPPPRTSAEPQAAAPAATGPAAAGPSTKPAGAASAAAAPSSNTSYGSGPGCEEAKRRWQGETTRKAAPEPSGQVIHQLTATLNNGTYLATCGVPQSASVSVCAAVVGGKATGVTARLEGGSPAMADCVARAVEAMSFDNYPDMLLAKTKFQATP